MPGLVPGIHVLLVCQSKAWMAGTSPAMTAGFSNPPHQTAIDLQVLPGDVARAIGH
jgi:hypothetical protein